MKWNNRKERKNAIELLEESVQLLRQAPFRAWSFYYIGSVPFVMGLLYFWSDMSRGAMAYDRCGMLSLALAGCYIWMRYWQSVFCGSLRAMKNGRAPLPYPGKVALSRLLIQTRWSSWSLLALPVANLLMIPAAWSYAFHQNLTAMGMETGGKSETA
ncbi:MAG: hypothetical protein V2A34_09480, partial [Lentisphaerota bacterium]